MKALHLAKELLIWINLKCTFGFQLLFGNKGIFTSATKDTLGWCSIQFKVCSLKKTLI